MSSYSIEESKNYINSLELPKMDIMTKYLSSRLPLRDEEKPSAAVDCGSLVSFVSEVVGQPKSDILNSTLLAQLAASKLHDRNKDAIKWYDKYVEVLGKVGWNVPSFTYKEYTPSGSTFTLDKAIIEVLSAIASENEMLALITSLESLKDKKNENQLSLFENQSFPESRGTFQIMPAGVSGGNAIMILNATQFQAEVHTTRFLWCEWKSSSVKLIQSAQKCVLNNDVYGKVRDEVVKKLGKAATDYISNLDI